MFLLLATLSAAPLVAVQEGDLRIAVAPLDLGVPEAEAPAVVARITAEKAAENWRIYGPLAEARGYDSLVTWAQAEGYYRSPAHRAWAEAACVRSGGLLPAGWWLEIDPFGGTAGNGPKILPQGVWPQRLARVAMAHDTDWTLGRYFGKGPLAPLLGAPEPPERLGPIGLIHRGGRYQDVPSYLGGVDGWEVQQVDPSDQPAPDPLAARCAS